MTIFTVLEHPDRKPERVVFVPDGFCWSALAFTVLWALWHRMWVAAMLLFALSGILTVAVNLQLLGSGLGSLLQFGIALIFAFEARNLQVASLERAGFRRAGLIQASRRDVAELSYFAGRPPTVTDNSGKTRYRAAPEDTLGIFGNV